VWAAPSAESRKNSKTALIVLAVVVALVIGLVACCAMYFSNADFGMSFVTKEEDSFSDRWSNGYENTMGALFGWTKDFGMWMDELFSGDVIAVAPEYTPDIRLPDTIEGMADDEFLETVDRLIDLYLQLSFTEYAQVEWEGLKMYRDASFGDSHLAELAVAYVDVVGRELEVIVGTGDEAYIGDWYGYLALENEKYEILIELIEDYGRGYPEMADEYRAWAAINDAEIRVDDDLYIQLLETDPMWSDEHGAYYLPYTNHTEFSFRMTYSSEYSGEDGIWYDDGEFDVIQPGETVQLVLWEYTERYYDWDEWYIDWDASDVCYNGVDIYEYYLQ